MSIGIRMSSEFLWRVSLRRRFHPRGEPSSGSPATPPGSTGHIGGSGPIELWRWHRRPSAAAATSLAISARQGGIRRWRQRARYSRNPTVAAKASSFPATSRNASSTFRSSSRSSSASGTESAAWGIAFCGDRMYSKYQGQGDLSLRVTLSISRSDLHFFEFSS